MHLLIAAAGSGRRMGASGNKLFGTGQTSNDHILTHTLAPVMELLP